MQYILDHHTAVPETDPFTWAAWMEENDLVVARTDNGVLFVSTVFLGINHGLGRSRPLLFETMAFFKEDFAQDVAISKVDFSFELGMDRYSTWNEAEKGHYEMTQRLFSRLDNLRGPVREITLKYRLDRV